LAVLLGRKGESNFKSNGKNILVLFHCLAFLEFLDPSYTTGMLEKIRKEEKRVSTVLECTVKP